MNIATNEEMKSEEDILRGSLSLLDDIRHEMVGNNEQTATIVDQNNKIIEQNNKIIAFKIQQESLIGQTDDIRQEMVGNKEYTARLVDQTEMLIKLNKEILSELKSQNK